MGLATRGVAVALLHEAGDHLRGAQRLGRAWFGLGLGLGLELGLERVVRRLYEVGARVRDRVRVGAEVRARGSTRGRERGPPCARAPSVVFPARLITGFVSAAARLIRSVMHLGAPLGAPLGSPLGTPLGSMASAVSREALPSPSVVQWEHAIHPS